MNDYCSQFQSYLNFSTQLLRSSALTSKRSSSHLYMCSSYWVFLELTKVESSDQEGNDTQVSLSTYNQSAERLVTTSRHVKKAAKKKKKDLL